MSKIKTSRWVQILLAVGTLLAISIQPSVNAAFLSNRSVNVSTARPSAIAEHTFNFTYVSADDVGSVVFEYCDSPVFDYPCSAPAGLDVDSATLLNQSGNIGFSIDAVNTTANKIVLTRVASAPLLVASSYEFGNVTNPSTSGQSTFIRLSTYGSTDGSGAFIDNGAVAFATLEPFAVGASVPPFLDLCVAITVSASCLSSTGDRLNLGTLTTSGAKAGTSQFSVGTNSVGGYIVFVQGTTLTSGNNAIAALNSPTSSFPGNNQFGINLRDNSNPNVGANPSGSGSGAPTPNYNTPNLFMYKNGEAIANSTLPSDYNRMTVSYLVNINKTQPPGVYSSTFTYLATANF